MILYGVKFQIVSKPGTTIYSSSEPDSKKDSKCWKKSICIESITIENVTVIIVLVGPILSWVQEQFQQLQNWETKLIARNYISWSFQGLSSKKFILSLQFNCWIRSNWSKDSITDQDKLYNELDKVSHWQHMSSPMSCKITLFHCACPMKNGIFTPKIWNKFDLYMVLFPTLSIWFIHAAWATLVKSIPI